MSGFTWIGIELESINFLLRFIGSYSAHNLSSKIIRSVNKLDQTFQKCMSVCPFEIWNSCLQLWRIPLQCTCCIFKFDICVCIFKFMNKNTLSNFDCAKRSKFDTSQMHNQHKKLKLKIEMVHPRASTENFSGRGGTRKKYRKLAKNTEK